MTADTIIIYRRVFWKCDFSCELFILPTCVPSLYCTLRVATQPPTSAAPAEAAAGGTGDWRQSHGLCWTAGPLSRAAAAAEPDARFCTGMLLPGGVMPGGMVSAMFSGGMPGMHVMQPRYR